MATSNGGIDLAAIEADVAKMSPEDIRKALLDFKVKQNVTTKKYYNPETAKRARQKKSAMQAEMVKLAKAAGIYDEIVAEAKTKAEEILAEEGADTDEEEGVAE